MAGKRSKKQIPFAISPLVWGYIYTLKKQGTVINSAYLFGSWAKGTQHKDSDIDLAIVSPMFTSWHKKTQRLAKAKYLDLVDVEPHGFHPKDFKPEENPVAYEVVKHGIKII